MTTATPAMARGELLWSPAPDALDAVARWRSLEREDS
jgi:hypothetical protein